MSTFRKANTRTQWFQDKYPGAPLNLTADTMVLVIHTTEGTGWPGYDGGAIAPNDTAKPNIKAKQLDWRAHFPDERSSRALQNQAGGVETNTLNAVQVELVGTCDPTHAHRWGSMRAGVDYIYWPDAPDWALLELAEFIADLHHRHGLRLHAPAFKAYPDSFGLDNGVRMSGTAWSHFAGICGHQHIPENVHGDPGALPIGRILQLARAHAAGAKPPAPKPPPASKRASVDEQTAANIATGIPPAKVKRPKVAARMRQIIARLRAGTEK